MKIATWNVNSLRIRQDTVLDWLEHNKPDVLCMQETKMTDQEFPEDAFGDLSYDAVYFGQPAYNGVAIISRPEMFEVVKGFPGAGDQEKRLIAATIDGVRIVGVYAPNGQSVGSEKYAGKLEWFKRLRAWLDATAKPEQPVVVCGDFNVAPEDIDVHDPIAWRGSILFSEPEKAALSSVMDFGFSDAFRHIHPGARKFSWWDYRAGSWERNLGLRIDHFLVTRPVLERTVSVTMDETVRAKTAPSDHIPVVLEIR